jgi:hypothetical protein
VVKEYERLKNIVDTVEEVMNLAVLRRREPQASN